MYRQNMDIFRKTILISDVYDFKPFRSMGDLKENLQNSLDEMDA